MSRLATNGLPARKTRSVGALLVGAAGLALLVSGWISTRDAQPVVAGQDPETRLRARPGTGGSNCAPGDHLLQLVSGRKALMHVAPRRPGTRRVLLLALHGAGSGGARGGLWIFRRAWNAPGLVIVAPAAAGTTWTLDGRDVQFVDRALQRAFARCRVDPRRVAVGGFSAGASMALWLGLTNGDLFHAVIALSPGSTLPRERVGKPGVFVAHGKQDEVIPIPVGDLVVSRLRREGYRVTYRRFDGSHRVVPTIARQGVRSALGV